MESPNNTHVQLIDLVDLLKYKKELLEDTQKQVNKIKDEIRVIMKTNDIKTFDDDDKNVHVKISYPKVFDIGTFKMEMPGFAASFITQETTTKTKDVLDKKRLMSRYPDDYAKYLIDLTPRLVVK